MIFDLDPRVKPEDDRGEGGRVRGIRMNLLSPALSSMRG